MSGMTAPRASRKLRALSSIRRSSAFQRIEQNKTQQARINYEGEGRAEKRREGQSTQMIKASSGEWVNLKDAHEPGRRGLHRGVRGGGKTDWIKRTISPLSARIPVVKG